MVPTESPPPDVWFDAWSHRMKFVGGVVLGAFLAGVFTLLWGDSRYVRSSDFAKHEEVQAKVEEHAGQDKATFATKKDLEDHVRSPAHSQTAIVNAEQERQIRELRQRASALEKNQAWVANTLFRMAKRQGIALPPPPTLVPDSVGNGSED